MLVGGISGLVLLGYIASDSRFGYRTETVLCSRCSAEVPLLDSRGAQCLYCLKGIPVPAGSTVTGESSRLRIRLQSELAEVRESTGAKGAAWTFALASVVLAGAIGALAVFGVGYLGFGDVSVGTVIAGGVLCGAILFVSTTIAFVRHLWNTASIPYARLAATGDSLDAFCSACDEELSSKRGAVASCPSCGTDNLLPAHLVPKAHRPKYVAVLGRRLQTDSLEAARAIAKTHSEELVGWFVVGLGCFFVVAWSAWSTLASAPLFFNDPVGSVGIPLFALLVFLGFGSHTILSARSWRGHLTDRKK